MESKKKRSSFSGQIGFVLAAAGSAVGLGNVCTSICYSGFNLWFYPVN